MARKRYTAEQNIGKLREAEVAPTAVVVEVVAVVAGEMERETGLEPATLCLGSTRATPRAGGPRHS